MEISPVPPLLKRFTRKRSIYADIRETPVSTVAAGRWDGGSVDYYTLHQIGTNRANPIGGAPFLCPREELDNYKTTIPKGWYLVRTGSFAGKPSSVHLYFCCREDAAAMGVIFNAY